MKAFVLAGGKGTRLRPLTFELPKVMIPIKRKPVLEWNLKNLIENGVGYIVIGINKEREKNKAIKNYFNTDWSRHNRFVSIQYSEDDNLGTGGALKKAEKKLSQSDYLIVTNGDEAKNVPYREMLESMPIGAKGMIALVYAKNSQGFGLAKFKISSNQITGFIEKPLNGKPGWINAGAYILSSEVFDLIPENKHVSLERDVFPLLAKTGVLYGYQLKEPWFPLDTMQRYEKAIKEWKGFN